LQYDRHDLEIIISSLRQQQQTLTDECERLDRRAEDCKGIIANLKVHASDLESHLKPHQKKYNELKHDIEKLRSEKAKLTSSLSRLRGEIPGARKHWFYAQLKVILIVILTFILSR